MWGGQWVDQWGGASAAARAGLWAVCWVDRWGDPRVDVKADPLVAETAGPKAVSWAER